MLKYVLNKKKLTLRAEWQLENPDLDVITWLTKAVRGFEEDNTDAL